MKKVTALALALLILVNSTSLIYAIAADDILFDDPSLIQATSPSVINVTTPPAVAPPTITTPPAIIPSKPVVDIEPTTPKPSATGTEIIFIEKDNGIDKPIIKSQSQTRATSRASLLPNGKISDLPIGTEVIDYGTKYNGEPIVWIIAHKNVAGYASTNANVVLVSKDVLSLKVFDAAETSNPNADRKVDGNNNYELSNVRKWLNSDKPSWHSNSHSYDRFPDYRSEAGFLSNFSHELINTMLPFSVKVSTPTSETGLITLAGDKVSIPSKTELGLGAEIVGGDGVAFSYFADATKRKSQTVKYDIAGDRIETPAGYYTRTSNASTFGKIRSIDTTGSINDVSANDTNVGVRPMIVLPEYFAVNRQSSADGSYQMLAMQPFITKEITNFSGGQAGNHVKLNLHAPGATSFELWRGNTKVKDYTGMSDYIYIEEDGRYHIKAKNGYMERASEVMVAPEARFKYVTHFTAPIGTPLNTTWTTPEYGTYRFYVIGAGMPGGGSGGAGGNHLPGIPGVVMGDAGHRGSTGEIAVKTSVLPKNTPFTISILSTASNKLSIARIATTGIEVQSVGGWTEVPSGGGPGAGGSGVYKTSGGSGGGGQNTGARGGGGSNGGNGLNVSLAGLTLGGDFEIKGASAGKGGNGATGSNPDNFYAFGGLGGVGWTGTQASSKYVSQSSPKVPSVNTDKTYDNLILGVGGLGGTNARGEWGDPGLQGTQGGIVIEKQGTFNATPPTLSNPIYKRVGSEHVYTINVAGVKNISKVQFKLFIDGLPETVDDTWETNAKFAAKNIGGTTWEFRTTSKLFDGFTGDVVAVALAEDVDGNYAEWEYDERWKSSRFSVDVAGTYNSTNNTIDIDIISDGATNIEVFDVSNNLVGSASSSPAQLGLNKNGTYMVKSSNGTMEVETTYTATEIDDLSPVITYTPISSSWAKEKSTTITLTDKNMVGMQYKVDEGTWQSYSAPFSLDFTQSGIKKVIAKDKWGIETPISIDIEATKIDNTPPTAPEIIKNPDLDWSKDSFEITIIPGVDAESGIEKSQYKINDEEWRDYSLTFTVTTMASITAKTIDNVDNSSIEATSFAGIDAIGPQGDITSSNDGWATKKIISYTATDVGSGVNRIKVSGGQWILDDHIDLEVTTNGAITFEAEDNVGWNGMITHVETKIDNTPPTIEMTLSEVTEETQTLFSMINSFFNKKIKVEFIGADAESGVNKIQYQMGTTINAGDWVEYDQNAPPVINKNFSGRVYGRVINNAGADFIKSSDNIVIEITPPTPPKEEIPDDPDAEVEPDYVEKDWSSTGTAFKTTSVAPSGIEKYQKKIQELQAPERSRMASMMNFFMSPATPLVVSDEWVDFDGNLEIHDEGIYRADIRSVSNAGGISEVSTYKVKNDFTAPTATHSIEGNKYVIDAKDNLSGVKQKDCTTHGANCTLDKNNAHDVFLSDNAGNNRLYKLLGEYTPSGGGNTGGGDYDDTENDWKWPEVKPKDPQIDPPIKNNPAIRPPEAPIALPKVDVVIDTKPNENIGTGQPEPSTGEDNKKDEESITPVDMSDGGSSGGFGNFLSEMVSSLIANTPKAMMILTIMLMCIMFIWLIFIRIGDNDDEEFVEEF